MEETYKIEVEVTVTEDGNTKIQVHQASEQDLAPDMIAMVLAGGLALAIRLSDDEAETIPFEYDKVIIDANDDCVVYFIKKV